LEIIGNLKRINSNIIYKNVLCEYEYDEYGGIEEGKLSCIKNDKNRLEGHYVFSNESIVMFIHLFRTYPDRRIAYFETIRLKRSDVKDRDENCLVLVTNTGLFHWQEIRIDEEKYKLAHYQNLSGIEIQNSLEIQKERMRTIRNNVEIILLYVQLVQLHYCKVFGYYYKNILYINYSDVFKKSFVYSRSELINKCDIENFVNKYYSSFSRDRIRILIDRLVYTRQAEIVEVRYSWVNYVFEGVESLFNKKYHFQNYKYINEILDEWYPGHDIIKIYFKKKNGTEYWKLLLSIYRNMLAHFIADKSELNPKPIPNQDKYLDLVFNEKHDLLLDEYHKCLYVAQKLICILLNINYDDDNEFLKIHEIKYKQARTKIIT